MFRFKARSRLFRRKLQDTDYLMVVLLSVVVGLAAGGGAVGVRFLIAAFTGLFYGPGEGPLELAAALPFWRVLLAPAIGGAIVGPIIWYTAREARGHGVPEVMAAVLLRQSRIRTRVAWIKALVSSLCIGSGGSAGREGPMAQVGSALGSALGQRLGLGERSTRTLLAAGAAGGIAAAFNAPLGGTLFALEVILGDFAVRSFSPVVISAVAATAVSRAVEGDVAVFTVPAYHLGSHWEFVPYSLLGIAAGLIAVIFIRFLYWQESWWEKLAFPEPLKPAVGGLVVGAVAVFFPHVLGSGSEAINGALTDEFGWTLLLLLIPLKLIATAVTLSSGGSGGVFAPSLFLGACLGGAFGQAVSTFSAQPVDPGAFALVGMGAVVAGATHAPITAVLIIFELTANYDIILPLIASCILATLVARILKRESIYTQKLQWMGIRVHEGREVGLLKSLSVRQVVTTEFTAFAPDDPLDAVVARALESRQGTYPVVDADNRLKGLIRFADLMTLMSEREELASLVLAQDVAVPPDWVSPGDNLRTALDLLSEREAVALPVVQGGRVVGMAFEKDILGLYSLELKKLELANWVTERGSYRAEARGIGLGEGLRLDETAVPEKLAGCSLRDADLRRRLGIEVLFVRRGERGIQRFPDPDRVLEKQDRLVVMGTLQALEALRTGDLPCSRDEAE
jgi:CIC family chloride channel protein